MRVRVYQLLLFAGDIIIFYAALALALLLRRPALFNADYYLHHVGFFSVILPVFLIVNLVIGLYDFRQIRDLPRIIGESLLAFFYTFIAAIAIYYSTSDFLPAPKTHLFLTLFFSTVMGIYWRRLWMSWSSSSVFATKTVFLCGNPVVSGMIADMEGQRYSRFRVVKPAVVAGWLERNEPGTPARGGKLTDLVDLIVVDADKLGVGEETRRILSAALEAGIPVRTHTDFYEEIYKKVPPQVIDQYNWMLTHVLPRRNDVYLRIKEITGRFAAALGVLVLLPLLPLPALAIKLEDGGPVFYSQPRLGFMRKPFALWKFRTMRAGADKEGYVWHKGKPDPRITRVGRFLRRFRLDELPQLWNVLRGEMALVGPRPTWTGEAQAWDLPDYNIRLLVKPGITGWAQINAPATESHEDTVEKLCYDLYYIKNISFALDLPIMLKTLRRVFEPEHVVRRRSRAGGAPR
ncbi:MAG TPA: exopolysaccharide biosynthesis polyprenyl glycosylphosphotransferase [Spirochaetota bacterium]|nr:exopolysaccharide biosynthesis polyprenyl glycosylphosphotransferase [Spirochaetota bacterium]